MNLQRIYSIWEKLLHLVVEAEEENSWNARVWKWERAEMAAIGVVELSSVHNSSSVELWIM